MANEVVDNAAVAAADVPAAPSLTRAISSPAENANNVMSDINAENATPVDHGESVLEASGSFACERFGDLQFRFKGAHTFKSSTVVFKWRVAGGDKVVVEEGKQTTKQAVNAAVVKLMLGPILGPMMLGPGAKKRDNEIELTVWSEQLYTLKACPGVKLDWSFKVKDDRKVDFSVVHRVDLVKSLRYNEELMKAWSKQQVKIQPQNQISQEERDRIRKEVQEYESGKNEAKRKTEELRQQLRAQAELAQKKLTKLLKDQEQIRLVNANKDETIANLGDKVASMETQRLAYLKQVNNLNECVKSLQTEKARCVERLWKERELVAKKDQELVAQAQTLRALESQLEKYRQTVANSGDEKTKLSDEIAALTEQIKEHDEAILNEKLKFVNFSSQQKTKIDILNLALTKASKQSDELQSKIDELIKKQQSMEVAMTEKDKQISEIHDKYQTTRGTLEQTNVSLDTARVELIHSKKALQLAKDERARAKSEDNGRIADLESTIQRLKQSTKQDLSDQTVAYQEVDRQLQQERLRCTKLGDANSSLRENVNNLRADVQKVTQERERAQSALAQLGEKCKALRENLQQVRAKANTAAKAAYKQRAATEASVAKRIAETQETLEVLRREHKAKFQQQALMVRTLQSKIATLQDQKRKSQVNASGSVAADDLAAARAQAAKIFATLKGESNHSIRQLQEKAEQQAATLRAQLSHAHNRGQSLSMQVEEARSQLRDSKVLNQSLEMEKETMAAELQAAKEALALCETRLLKSQDKERLLVEQCREFEFATNRKSRHIASHQTIIADLHQQLQKRRGSRSSTPRGRTSSHGSTSAATPPLASTSSNVHTTSPSAPACVYPRTYPNPEPSAPTRVYNNPAHTAATPSAVATPVAHAVAVPLRSAMAVPVTTSSPSAPAMATSQTPSPSAPAMATSQTPPSPVASARGRAFGNMELFSPNPPSRVYDAGDDFGASAPSRVYGHEDYFSPGAAPQRFLYSSQLSLLQQMGYGPQEKMLSLLVQYSGNVHRVVTHLLHSRT